MCKASENQVRVDICLERRTNFVRTHSSPDTGGCGRKCPTPRVQTSIHTVKMRITSKRTLIYTKKDKTEFADPAGFRGPSSMWSNPWRHFLEFLGARPHGLPSGVKCGAPWALRPAPPWCSSRAVEEYSPGRVTQSRTRRWVQAGTHPILSFFPLCIPCIPGNVHATCGSASYL